MDATSVEADVVFGEHFAARRRLKYGNNIDTFLGIDRRDDREVVIKSTSVRTLSPAAQLRLEHEADVLGRVRSEHLAPLLEIGRQDHVMYLVTPFVPGEDLQARLRNGPLNVDDALTLGVQTCRALEAAHAEGVLHRDLKPANLIVRGRPRLEHVTLIDFGLARSAQLDRSIRDQPVGTARYISPEQAGLLDCGVAESSDLYSLGVMLHEALAGEAPFQGENLGEVLRRHMTERPANLRDLGLDVPRALDEVVQRLLKKDPRDRYQSAVAVAADLDQIRRARQQGDLDPTLVVGRDDRRETLTEPAFVGREQELRTLDAERKRALRGGGRLVRLGAESGVGKTRLLAEAAQRATRQGDWVLRAQGRDQVGQQPFQMLGGLAEQVARAAELDQDLGQRLRDAWSGHRDALRATLPMLEPCLDSGAATVPRRPGLARTQDRQALTVWLQSLGTAQRPALVILDDCQWADEMTIGLLAHWQQNAERPRHLTIIVAYRPEEVGADHPLSALQTKRLLELDRFRPDEIRRLAESMAGRLPEAALEAVEAFSDGSPFMASAVLRGLVESGGLVFGEGQWQVQPEALEHLQSSRHAAAFLARRLRLLPRRTFELLSVAAVLGKEFEVDAAAHLCTDPTEVLPALHEARRRHLVWELAGRTWAFVHDKLREALLSQLDTSRRPQLHLKAANYLERQQPADAVSLAYHLDAAGEHQRALPYALQSAEEARHRHSLESAQRHYEMALRAQPKEAVARLQIASGLGDVLMLQGHYDGAEEHLITARSLADGPLAWAASQRELGELAFKRGDMEAACQALEAALQRLGQSVPRSTAGLLARTLWEGLVQGLHTLLPAVFVGRREADGAATELQIVRLLSRLAYAYWYTRGRVPTFWVHLRELNLAERFRPATLELAQAYSEHAPAMSMIPFPARGIAYANKSLAIRKQLEDVWGQGQSLHFLGILLYVASRFDESIVTCREAIRLLQQTGDPWEVNIARYQIAASYYRKGELPRAIDEARRIHRSGKDLGDAQASGISLDIWAMASRGRVPEELLQEEYERPSADAQRTTQVRLARAICLLYDERPAEAAAEAESACQLADEQGLRSTFVSPVLPWWTTALRRQWECESSRSPGRRDALLRKARRVANRGLRLASAFRNDLPHALRERALIAAIEGRGRLARRMFRRGLQVAELQGAQFEFAQTLLAQGEIGEELGWEGWQEDQQRGRSGIDQVLGQLQETAKQTPQTPVTLSLADRFDTVLESGRLIASKLTRETIFAEMETAARRLLRAETCWACDLRQGDLESQLREAGRELSQALVDRASASGRPVSLVEGMPDDTSESMILSGVRSALCAPVFQRGELVGIVYASHRNVIGLFGEDEIRLAGFITTIAGAALENAAGFADLQQLNETLEQRVAERTADAESRAQELQRSNEDLEQFAYVASHDLQEPLRTIASFCQLIERRYCEQLDAEAIEFIGYAVDGAQRMQGLIRDLLAYSRVSRQQTNFRTLDANSLIDRVRFNLKVSLEQNEGELIVEPLPTISGDESQLTLLFQNLIGNALKFRGDRAPVVTVSAARQGDLWCFSVADNGIGIAEEHLARIFQIFQRLHSRDQYEGTGIGLAVCKKTVERHGGTIWVESCAGEGSTFSFTLPAVDEDSESRKEESQDSD